MFKLNKILLSILCLVIPFFFAFAQQESITITTYYPSPYGSYRELRAQRMAIGDNYINRSTACWDPPCPGGGVDISDSPTRNIDLIVEGNVGIGTTAPTEKLHVEGNVVIKPSSGGSILKLQTDGSSNSGVKWYDGTTEKWAMYRLESSNSLNIENSELPGAGIFINSTGNVGLGTTSPLSKLSVGRDGYANTGIYSYGLGTAIWAEGGNFGVYASGNNGVEGVATFSGGYGVMGIGGATGVYGNGTYGVLGSGSTYGVLGSGSAVGSIGVYGSGSAAGSIGVYGSGTNSGVQGYSASNYGVYGSGVTGVCGNGTTDGVAGSGSTFGVVGYSGNGFGVYGVSTNSYGVYGSGPIGVYASGSNYGVEGISSNNTGVYGVSNYSYGVYCTGIYCGGNVAWTPASDIRLKENIVDLPASDGLDAIMRLRPITFHWRDANLDQRKGEQFGLIAQEVQGIFPQLVVPGVASTAITLADGSTQVINNALAMDYSGFVVPLVKAIQEQQKQIEELKVELASLKGKL